MNTSNITLNSVLAFQKTATVRATVRVNAAANERLTMELRGKENITVNNSVSGGLTSR